MYRLSVKSCSFTAVPWNYTKLDPPITWNFRGVSVKKTAHVSRIPRLQSSPVTFLLFTNPFFLGEKWLERRRKSSMWRPPKFRGLALCGPIHQRVETFVNGGYDSCGFDSLRAACLRWMTNGKAQSYQWSLDILLYCCTRFRKQVKTRWQRTRSTLSIFHVQCFSSKPHGVFSAEIWLLAW